MPEQAEVKGKEEGGAELVAVVLQELAKAREETNKRFDELEALIRSVVPGGDIDGHRNYHAALIRRSEKLDKLYTAIIEKTLTGIAWGFLLWLGVAVWQTLKNQIKG